MATTYGNPTRISVSVEGGGLGVLDLDTYQKVVLFARGDPDAGTASVNDPTRVTAGGELEDTFGADTPLTEMMRGAAGNGVSYNLLYGVMPEATETTETVTADPATLEHDPIVEDASLVTVTDTTTSTDLTPVWRYESPPDPSELGENEVAINPHSGEIATGSSGELEVTYEHLDWQSAFDSATHVIQEQEDGLWYVRSEAERVLNDAIVTARPLRESEWKMVRVAGDAEPNATAVDGSASFDTLNYDDALDDDALWAFAPVRQAESDVTVSGGIAGLLGSRQLSDSIIGMTLSGYGSLSQTLPVPQQEELEEDGVVPLSNVGAPTIEGNLSTSTETDFTRSYFIRRLADRLILAARAIGRAARGRVNNDRTSRLVEGRLGDEILELVEDGLLEPNTRTEQKWFVDATEDPNDPQTLKVSFGFTPEGIIDTVTFDATVNL